MRIGRIRAASLHRIGFIGAAVGLATTSLWALPAGAATVRANNATSSYGSYWVTTPTNGLVSESDTFVVPTLNCTGNTGQLGQDFGVTDNTRYVESVVQMECNGTVPSYQFVVAVNTTSFTENGVSAGDTVVTSWYQTATLAEAKVHDLTSGFTWIADGTPPGFNDSAVYGELPVFVLVDGAYQQLHIAPFTTTTFAKCQVNGDYLGYSANLEAFNLREGDGAGANILTSALEASHDSFKLTFKHS